MKNNLLWILWKSVSIVLHTIGFLTYGYSMIYQALMGNNRSNDPRASIIGDFKYMTYWNLLFQFVFHSLSLVCDIMPGKRQDKTFVKWIDTMFHTIVFPLAIFVSTSFWVLCSLDANLVRNPISVNRYPNWYNHVTHTMIGPMNVLELIITYHEEPKQNHGLIIIITLYLLYFFWILFLGIFADLWVYPFLAKLNWSQRITFAVVCGASLCFYCIGCVFVSKLCWPKARIRKFRQTVD